MKRDGSEMDVHDLRWKVPCSSHLEAGARAPAGRTLQRAVALVCSGAAGRQSPWQLGSLPGSSPPGS